FVFRKRAYAGTAMGRARKASQAETSCVAAGLPLCGTAGRTSYFGQLSWRSESISRSAYAPQSILVELRNGQAWRGARGSEAVLPYPRIHLAWRVALDDVPTQVH